MNGERDLASLAWLLAKMAHDRAKRKLAEATETLREFGPGEAQGVKVRESSREGSVDWKTAAGDLWWDDQAKFDEWAEKYRRPGSTSILITEVQ